MKTISQTKVEAFKAAISDSRLLYLVNQAKVEVIDGYLTIYPKNRTNEHLLYRRFKAIRRAVNQTLKTGIDIRSFSGVKCRLEYTDLL